MIPHRKVRIRSFGFHLPEPRIELSSLQLKPEEEKRLVQLGQSFTYKSKEDSTQLMVYAAENALQKSGLGKSDIRLVISAPSLITSYGLEIPAIAVKSGLGLDRAQCLNVVQGCIGMLRGIELARQMLMVDPDRGDILVVTSCRASALMNNFNHGAFFWGDGGAAVIVTAAEIPGVEIVSYAEASADKNWGAMRIDFGDAEGSDSLESKNFIKVNFHSNEDKVNYIRGEQDRISSVIQELLDDSKLTNADIDSVFVPSTGKNRLSVLFGKDKILGSKVKTDFRYPHLGGVDPFISLHNDIQQQDTATDKWMMILSPAFAAQWGGLLLRNSL